MAAGSTPSPITAAMVIALVAGSSVAASVSQGESPSFAGVGQGPYSKAVYSQVV